MCFGPGLSWPFPPCIAFWAVSSAPSPVHRPLTVLDLVKCFPVGLKQSFHDSVVHVPQIQPWEGDASMAFSVVTELHNHHHSLTPERLVTQQRNFHTLLFLQGDSPTFCLTVFYPGTVT